MLAGSTLGDWSGTNAGNIDFAAVKLDSDGAEVWRWQVCVYVCVFTFVCPTGVTLWNIGIRPAGGGGGVGRCVCFFYFRVCDRRSHIMEN